MVAGLLLAAAGFALLTGLRADSSYQVLLPALLLWGLGLAALTPAFGAVAGTASNARAFVSGLHLTGLVAAALFLVAALSTLLMRSN
ncbi:hypothetical protein [Actinophytocola algeriensis]|uniref:Uncharacterized protein n=1 Tax=Actinophytocola algeriensis TaxID=1768010 RepID=A0A7W7Q8S6_9PSEU|nr:hypothetical protein [Actinophytocola algeriensis]MBB4908973.1 hypothetical protein [Actinophytocola algeriensis]MBE1474639.1 hypothetical protein [Actinophytocola algeriensis]